MLLTPHVRMEWLLLLLLTLVGTVCASPNCNSIFTITPANQTAVVSLAVTASLTFHVNSKELYDTSAWLLELAFSADVKDLSVAKVSIKRNGKGMELSSGADTVNVTAVTDFRSFLLFRDWSNVTHLGDAENMNFSFEFTLNTDREIPRLIFAKINDFPLCTSQWHWGCGLNVKESRLLVSHGKEIDYNDYPWIAAIFNRHSTGIDFNCGGSLVTARHIVTAAHCVKKEEDKKILHPDDLVVYMGKHFLTNFEDREVEVQGFSISRIIVHSDWTKTTEGKKDGDIAILVLSSPVNFTESVQPVCLFGENVVSKTSGAVVGWGLDETGSISQVPIVISMPAVSRQACLTSDDRFKPIVSNRTFCAGHRNGSGPCKGDSGGGFFTKSQLQGDHTRQYLSGIVSRSLSSPNNPCDLNHYIVFTDVHSYRPWIQCILHDPACPVESKSVDDYKDIKSRIRFIFEKDFVKNGKSYTMIIAISVCAVLAVLLVAIVVSIHILRKHRQSVEKQVRHEVKKERELAITKKTVNAWKTEVQRNQELRALKEQEEERERRERPSFFRRTWNGFTRIFTRTRSEEERVMETLMEDIIPTPRNA